MLTRSPALRPSRHCASFRWQIKLNLARYLGYPRDRDTMTAVIY